MSIRCAEVPQSLAFVHRCESSHGFLGKQKRRRQEGALAVEHDVSIPHCGNWAVGVEDLTPRRKSEENVLYRMGAGEQQPLSPGEMFSLPRPVA